MSRVPSCAARGVLASLILAGVLMAGVAAAATNVGSINFTLGGKRLSEPWFPAAPHTSAAGDTLATRGQQPALGIEVSWGRSNWPVMIALDVLHCYDDGVQRFHDNPIFSIPTTDVRRRVSTFEVGLGLRRAFDLKGWSPYIGGGGSWVRGNMVAEMSDPNAGEFGVPGPTMTGRHSAFGYWVGGGLYRRLGPRFQLGLTARLSKAMMLFPERGEVRGRIGGYDLVPNTSKDKIDAGGRHIGLVVGWSFPSRK
jgi:hypothetical protein